MRSERDASDIVNQIYGSIRSPDAWPQIVADISDSLGGDMAMMTSAPLTDSSPIPIVFHQMDLSAVQHMPLVSHPEFTLRALATGSAPGVFLFDELMSPDERQTSEYWRTIIEPLRIASGLLCVIRTPDDNRRPIVLSCLRRAGHAPFTSYDKVALAELLPHLRRALGVILDAPPPAVRQDAQEIYGHIGAPALLFGRDEKVIYRNRAADALLQSHDGMDLHGGRVLLSDGAAQKSFDAALKRVVGEAWTRKLRLGAELLANRTNGPPMILVLTPMGAENPIAQWATSARCVMFVLEEQTRTGSELPGRLSRVYGLTSSEADISVGFATGATVRALAQQRGTKPDTVRTQLKSAMAKIGTRRQSELAALVSRLRL